MFQNLFKASIKLALLVCLFILPFCALAENNINEDLERSKRKDKQEAEQIAWRFVDYDASYKPGAFISLNDSFFDLVTSDFKALILKAQKAEELSIATTPEGEIPCVSGQEMFFDGGAEFINAGKILGSAGNDKEKIVFMKIARVFVENGSNVDFSLHETKASLLMKRENNKWLVDDIIQDYYHHGKPDYYKADLKEQLAGDCYAVPDK